jgi:hypothetical protein
MPLIRAGWLDPRRGRSCALWHRLLAGPASENDRLSDASVGYPLEMVAGDSITIKTGKAMLIMKKDGSITLKGKGVLIDASGKD